MFFRRLRELERERGALLLLGMTALQIATLVVRAAKLGPPSHEIVGVVLLISALACALAIALPEAAIEPLRTAARSAAATPMRAALVLASVTLVVLVTNVFVQQPNAWDERGLLTAAPVIASRGFSGFSEAYKGNAWLGPQHPPLPALVHAAVWALGGKNVVAMRMIAVAFGCGAVLSVFGIGARLYGSRTGLLMAGLLLTSPLLVRITSAVTNDAPLLFFFCLAILLGLRLLDGPTDRRAIALGLVVGLGLLTKYTMILVYPVLIVLPWVGGIPSRPWRLLAIVLAVSLSMLGLWLLAAQQMGVLGQQSRNIEHLAGDATRDPRYILHGMLVRLPSAVGIFALPVILLGLVRCMRFERRADALILVWLVAIVVPLMATLPLNRFFLPAFPTFSAAMALAIEDRPASAPRVVLLLGALCEATLIYYGWVDLRIPLGF